MKLSPLIKTLISAAVVLALTVQKENGFLLVLLLPSCLIYLVVNAVRMTRGSGGSKGRGIRMAVWSAVAVLACSAQGYWGMASRSDADLASQKVLAYQARTGAYPASLRDAGLDDGELQKKWSLRYSVKGGRPELAYPAPVMPLTMYEYDFEARAWRINAY